jgi:hypothetical protein
MIVDDKITKKVKAKLKRGGGKARFWKVYDREGGELASPVYSHNKSGVISGPGLYASGRRTTNYPRYDDVPYRGWEYIGRGFHVLLTRAEARLWTDRRGVAIVPVWCSIAHLVAGGHTGAIDYRKLPAAVFTDLEILPEDFKKAVGQ